MNPSNVDVHGLPILPYIVFHQGAYIVNLPDDLGCPAKSFSLANRSPIEAQNSARRYRDRKLPMSHRARVDRRGRERELGPLPAVRGVTHRVRSVLGRAGVTISHIESRGVKSLTVSATGKDHANGTVHTRRFSVDRYGLEAALRHAIRKRLEWERRFYGHLSQLREADWVRFMLFAYEQFGGDPFELRALEHRGSIQDHGNGWLTATTSVDCRIRRQSFNVRHYGSKHEAWVAAILCCMDWQEELGLHRRRRVSAPTSRNRTTGYQGVCRRLIEDGRGRSALVTYEVLVYVNGKRRPRRFNAGREHRITAMHDLAAFEAAIAYRREYEHAVEAGIPFDPSIYSDWKVQFNHPSTAHAALAT